jgi:hypothetical protein
LCYFFFFASRPQRNRRQPDRFGFDSFIESHYSIPSAYTAEFGVLEPVIWKATSDPDTLSWNEAMAAPDCDEFLKAAALEIKTLEDNGTWEEVPVSEAQGGISMALGLSNANANALQMEPFLVTMPAIVFVVISWKRLKTLLLQWWPCYSALVHSVGAHSWLGKHND